MRGATLSSLQAETFPVLSSSTVYDRLACVRGYAQSLFVLLRHACQERPKSTLLASVASAHPSSHYLEECWCTPLAPGALLERAASIALRIMFLMFARYVSMFASFGSTILHCSFRTDWNGSQIALWYCYSGVRSISARPGSASPSTMCSGKWSDCRWSIPVDQSAS